MRFARLINRTDVKGLLQIDNARQPTHASLVNIPAQSRLVEMHVFDENSGRVYAGWRAVAKVLTVVPLLSLAYPIMVALDSVGIGQKIYKSISHRAGQRRCGGDSCQIGVKI